MNKPKKGEVYSDIDGDLWAVQIVEGSVKNRTLRVVLCDSSGDHTVFPDDFDSDIFEDWFDRYDSDKEHAEHVADVDWYNKDSIELNRIKYVKQPLYRGTPITNWFKSNDGEDVVFQGSSGKMYLRENTLVCWVHESSKEDGLVRIQFPGRCLKLYENGTYTIEDTSGYTYN